MFAIPCAARLAVTVLSFVFWSAAEGRCYYTFCSHNLEQSGPYTVACLRELCRRLDMSRYHTLQWYSDVGPHFRAAYPLGYMMSTLFHEQRSLQQVHVTFPSWPWQRGLRWPLWPPQQAEPACFAVLHCVAQFFSPCPSPLPALPGGLTSPPPRGSSTICLATAMLCKSTQTGAKRRW